MKVLESPSRTFSDQIRWSVALQVCFLLSLLISTDSAFALNAADDRAFWQCPPHMASLKRQVENQFQNENYETVVELASRGIKACPELPLFYMKRAESYLLLSKTDLAIKDLTVASKLKPTVGWPLIARGRAYDSQGKDKLALEDYNHGIALGCVAGYRDQARVLERTGQYEKAVVSLNKLMPTIEILERIPYLFQRSKLYEKLGKKDLAIADKKLATELLDKSGGKHIDRY